MSYTEANPVAHVLECKAHKVTMSGDHIPDELMAMWEAMHADCDQEVGE